MRAQLLVLENIKSNVEIDEKPPPNKDKAKGADSKRNAESNNSCNPKGQERLDRGALLSPLETWGHAHHVQQ